ncbi:MAG: carboxy terminal-processing peptidase [Saprospiraceae bacterium]|nr:carboxy terminal-processing peptidase [Saprospiraceae bacterium]
MAESKDFQMVLESALQIKQNRDQTKYPLKINDYRSMINKKNEESKKFDNLFKNEIAGLDIKNLEADMAKINRDDSNIAKNQEFIKGLKKDIYIEESLFIIRDLINLKSLLLHCSQIS